jgi:hypothetical protein
LMELVEKSLSPAGAEYVRSCLRQGVGLCSMLLPIVEAGGRTFAPVPRGTDQKRAEEFHSGGLMSRREMIAWLAEHLNGIFKTERRSTVIFQDVWAAPTDRAVRSATSNKLLNDSQVYYFIQAEEFESSLIERVLRELTSYLLIGVLTRFPISSAELTSDYRTTEKIIISTAREALEIFVGAYDQEGVVIWRR